MAGVENPFVATILKSLMGLIGVSIGIYLSYKVLGRRSMMLIGHATSAVFMAGMGIAQSVAPGSKAAGKAIVGCALCYHFCYNGFSGAQSYPVANEVVSSRLRVISVGTATAVNMVFACQLPLSFSSAFHRHPSQFCLHNGLQTMTDGFCRANRIYDAVLHQ